MLETELETKQTLYQESLKEIRQCDRKVKETCLQLDDEKRNGIRLQDLIDKLQEKLKIYKRQAEEAEEAASISFSKLRKVHLELEESTEKEKNHVEHQTAKIRANTRSAHSQEQSSLVIISNTNKIRASSNRN